MRLIFSRYLCVMKQTFLSFFLIFSVLFSWSQERTLTAGFQFKPMLPAGFFNAAQQESLVNDTTFNISQRFGYSAGGVVRYGFTDRFAFETGISFIQRNFTLDVTDLDGEIDESLEYRIIGYEIPIRGLFYVRLSRDIYMNAAFGGTVDMFPSDVATANEVIQHETVRRSWINAAIEANLGFEYRTEKDGTFYLGGSFHRPFTPIYLSKIGKYQSRVTDTAIDILGSYVTLDLRYFFHEDPRPRKAKKSKRSDNR